MTSSQAVKLPNRLLRNAKKYGTISKRSIPKQLEYWIEIGQLAEEYPDLPYSFIKNTLISIEEIKNDEISEYSFG